MGEQLAQESAAYAIPSSTLTREQADRLAAEDAADQSKTKIKELEAQIAAINEDQTAGANHSSEEAYRKITRLSKRRWQYR